MTIKAGERILPLTKNLDFGSAFPQMSLYEKMPSGVAYPYSMMGNPANFRSDEINTDNYGFRFSHFQGETVSLENLERFDRVNILIGGSTVFGVGSSSDATTISSLLADLTREPWLNMGVRAAVSFQEYLHLVQHFKKAKSVGKVVVFSGINDIYRNLMDDTITLYDKRFQYQNDLYAKNSAKRIAYAYLMSLITNKNVNNFLHGYQNGSGSKSVAIDKIGAYDLRRIFDRNFHLYSALASYTGFELKYFIQPFFPLTGKVGTKQETEAIRVNEMRQANTNWLETKARIVDEYDDVCASLFELAGRYHLPIYDSNDSFKSEETFFVDNVHLGDAGNRRAAEVINAKI